MFTPISAAMLEAEGFAGFVTIGQLHRSGCAEVPDERGVYVVLVRGDAPHGFLARSTAPLWRKQDPTEREDVLAAHWVEGARLLYVGLAPGPGVRSRLRQRVKRFLRFGHGSVVAHWAGRYIWQLRESSRLEVAWRSCGEAEDPAAIERALLARFERQHGALPFANARGVSATEDGATSEPE